MIYFIYFFVIIPHTAALLNILPNDFRQSLYNTPGTKTKQLLVLSIIILFLTSFLNMAVDGDRHSFYKFIFQIGNLGSFMASIFFFLALPEETKKEIYALFKSSNEDQLLEQNQYQNQGATSSSYGQQYSEYQPISNAPRASSPLSKITNEQE
ncbi:MAG: hypothetical protein EZS28_028286 [Streblomastix strix]|uniref:Uncharacterized protein n=1 Tax=Streblomastix strix TaxID=222440 RepID=A0A5J4V0G0_9EUKA|nr:MAG: hypothetical protein EZS28_028286 [Streblomastix strix]